MKRSSKKMLNGEILGSILLQAMFPFCLLAMGLELITKKK